MKIIFKDFCEIYFSGSNDLMVEWLNDNLTNEPVRFITSDGKIYDGNYITHKYEITNNHLVDGNMFLVKVSMKSGQHGGASGLIYTNDITLPKAKYKKIKRPDIDPFDEEIWVETIDEQYEINEWKKANTFPIKTTIKIFKLFKFLEKTIDSIIDEPTDGAFNYYLYECKSLLNFYNFINRPDIIEKLNICEKKDDRFDESIEYIINEHIKLYGRRYFRSQIGSLRYEINTLIDRLKFYKPLSKNRIKMKLMKLLTVLSKIKNKDIDPLGEEDWGDDI